jgi:hypothetical protein
MFGHHECRKPDNEPPLKFRLPRVTYNRSHNERECHEDTEAALHGRVQGIGGQVSSVARSRLAVFNIPSAPLAAHIGHIAMPSMRRLFLLDIMKD